jgi:hypothetical protein
MKLVAFVAGASLSFGIFACDGDSPVSAGDTEVEDSALALSVMTARGDTLGAPVENELIELPNFTDVKVKSSAPAAPSKAKVVASPPRPAAASKQASPIIEQKQPTIVAPAAPVVGAEPEQPRIRSRRERPAIAERPSKAARTGMISSGSALVLFTNQKVCDKSGSFRAVVSHTVRGTNGAVIPAGAQASTEITSVDKWGAGIGVRVTSVRFDGRSYPVSSRVAYVLPESNGCIPAQARIEVEMRGTLEVEVLN